jgi:hypothetical protein
MHQVHQPNPRMRKGAPGKLKSSIVPLALLAFCLASPAQQGEPAETGPRRLSYVDLVKRLTDLDYLATLPEPGEKTAQCSSYDRASRYDDKTGKYVRWDANGDADGIIRKEDGKLVLAEMTGPGCIWRIWSAAPKQGHVRIYLDDASEPAVDLPFAGYFDGKNPPFTRPELVHVAASGCNNYTPIPYQKSCKIVADDDWGAYYHFGYTTFPKGTLVPTFRRDLSAEDNAALDEADRILSHCGPREAGPGCTRTGGDRLIGTDGAWTETKLDGAGAITLIRVKPDLPAEPADPDALREMALEIRWDGEKSAAVWSPLGDFFGTAPGMNVYRSLPCGMTEDGWFYANWRMPFTNGAEIRFINDGAKERRLKYELCVEKLEGDLSRFGRFHAKWHRNEFLPTAIDRQIDWPLLVTEGRGRLVGVMLHVWNPRGGWWGEGDEKFFVDGEKFPSTFGTGSEDYFGYAWGNPQLFEHAYHNQTHNDGNNRGNISVNRWHIADQVPFQKSFEADIEKYFPDERPTLYAATVYWYLDAAGSDPYSPQPVEERTGYCVPAPPPAHVAGAIEGEALKVLGKTGGTVQQQDMAGFGDQWSGDAQLWWTDAKPGDQLDLALPVAGDGKCRLRAQFTRAVDYGTVQIAVDGEKVGAPIDLYHDGVVASGELELGELALKRGEHKLTLTITGANPQAVKRFMVGLDYVKVLPAP